MRLGDTESIRRYQVGRQYSEPHLLSLVVLVVEHERATLRSCVAGVELCFDDREVVVEADGK